jgi:hypothetical protein
MKLLLGDIHSMDREEFKYNITDGWAQALPAHLLVYPLIMLFLWSFYEDPGFVNRIACIAVSAMSAVRKNSGRTVTHGYHPCNQSLS